MVRSMGMAGGRFTIRDRGMVRVTPVLVLVGMGMVRVRDSVRVIDF